MPSANEVNERYAEARFRRNKRTGLVLMLAGLVGTLVMGAFLVIVLVNGVFSLTLLSLSFVCLFTFLAGLNGWRSGGNAIKAIDENIGGPFS